MIQPSSERGGLVIYGAGGQGQVAAEAADAAGWRVLGFLDDAVAVPDTGSWPLLTPDDPRVIGARLHVAIGDNAARQRKLASLRGAARIDFASIIHPTAYVSPSARVGAGCFVGPRAVVHAHADVGDGAIVNTGAIVEHHCRVGACAHIAPGAVMGGGCSIGELALVGLGARLLPRLRIGDRATVGAGAVVLENVADGATVAGVPAQPR